MNLGKIWKLEKYDDSQSQALIKRLKEMHRSQKTKFHEKSAVKEQKSIHHYKLSNIERVLIRSLHLKKYRYQHKLFLIEGLKPVKEALLADFPVESIYISSKLDESSKIEIIGLSKNFSIKIYLISQKEINRISSLKTPEGIIAVGKINEKDFEFLDEDDIPALYLWQVSDPGNLGTIIRTSLWFDVKRIFISPGSVDVYSSKVVRGSMGAIFHMKISPNIDFELLYNRAKGKGIKFLAADMSGNKLSEFSLGNKWILVFGSESHGLPKKIIDNADYLLSIRKRGYGESLNLGVSVGIFLNELLYEDGED